MREKIIRICQNGVFKKFTFMRFSISCITSDKNLFSINNLCNQHLTHIICKNKTRTKKCHITVLIIVLHLQALLDDFDYSDDEEETVDRKLPGQGEGLQVQLPDQQQQQQQDNNPPVRYRKRVVEASYANVTMHVMYQCVLFTGRVLTCIYMYVQ